MIPTEFLRTSYLYTLEEHRGYGDTGIVAIYRQEGGRAENGGVFWEVVVFRWAKEREIMGRTVPAGWRYPASEDWGTYGFTLMTRERAAAKFEWLCDRMEEKMNRGEGPTDPPTGGEG
jgi:hypothetical protein